MKKKESKKLIVPFLLLFLVSFLIINWEDISWVFNYRFITAALSNFFEKSKPEKPQEFSFSEKENSIEIPKIEVSAPIVFSEKEEDFEKALKEGVLHYPQSVLPGERGEVIILGHSAPAGWPKINYDWVFNRLNELTQGDEILVYFNHRKYSYRVFEKVFLEPNQELPEIDSTNSQSILTLLTCWPPGKDFKRIAVKAKLEKPNPLGN